MRLLLGFAAFWYDFIVGDSWELAVGVLAVLLAAKVIEQIAPVLADSTLFWLAPGGILAMLGISLARAER
jgi:hypothetical protein